MSLRPPCIYQPACPGCPRFASRELAPERKAQLLKLAKCFELSDVEFYESEGFGYRHQVKLMARGPVGRMGLGIFEARSHRLVAIPDCPVHHPQIQRLLPLLTRRLNEAGVPAYDEQRHQGLLRAVHLAVESESQRVQITFVLCSDLLGEELAEVSSQLTPVFEYLRNEAQVMGIYLNAQGARTNTIFGSHFVRIDGAESMSERSGTAEIFFPPGAFAQANPVMHASAVSSIFSQIAPDSRVVEYYAGVGSIGLGLLAQGRDVVFNEIGSGSLDGLCRGIEELGHNPDSRVLRGAAGKFADFYGPEDVVIVDPPRKGLDAGLLSRLQEERPRQLIYLSCGLDSLLRESESLKRAGYRLTSLAGYPYFPFTDHVESLAVFVPK